MHATNEFTDERGWSETEIVPTTAWLDWMIYQPARYIIIDFNDVNGHQDAENGINAASGSTTFAGGEGWSDSGTFTITEDTALSPTDTMNRLKHSQPTLLVSTVHRNVKSTMSTLQP